MKRRLGWWCLLSAAGALLLLRAPAPQTPPAPPEAKAPPVLRRLQARSAAAEHAAALLPPCPRGLRLPPPGAQADHDHPRGRLRVLRAYEDLRLRALPAVRVLATLEGERPPPPLFCHLWREGRFLSASRATPTEIWWPLWDAERSGSFERPFLLSCPYPDASAAPDRVTVTPERPCRPSALQLEVQPFPSGGAPPPGSVAVCVKGLDFPPGEDLSRRLLEWTEANRLLGAARFRLYWRRPPHPNVRRALRLLRRRGGDVEAAPAVRPWPPEELDLWQRRRLDVLDLTDCLYRSVGRHQFVLAIDVDEVMVPVVDPDWPHLLAKLTGETEHFASLAVQSYFFFSDRNASVLDVSWRSANWTREAVKSFVPTANALTLFNHYALHALVPGVLPRVALDPSLAQVNHYRQGCSVLLGQECNQTYFRFRQKDEVLIGKIGERLRSRVDVALKILATENN